MGIINCDQGSYVLAINTYFDEINLLKILLR